MILILILFLLLGKRTNSSYQMQGKTYFVTGATDGIGQHTATRLYKAGANVLLHGRDWNKLHKTKEKILGENIQVEGSKQYLKCYCADLQSLSGTKQLAKEIIASNEKLDGLINNAGVFQESLIFTEDGLESTFAVNVCAPYILVCLLLPLLKAVQYSKILNVSSISQSGQLRFDNLRYEKGGFSSYNSYGFSKLCIAAMSNELAVRIPAEDALVISCDPGTVNTKMLLAGWGYCGINIADANDEFNLISAPFDSSWHGQYFVGEQISRCSRDVYDATKRSELWSTLERITGVSLQ